MREIVLDAGAWRTPADFLEALKATLGMPDGHPLDLDAVVDSMIWEEENNIEAPYKLRIVNTGAIPAQVAEDIAVLARMVADARVLRRDQEGTDVGVRILLDGEEAH